MPDAADDKTNGQVVGGPTPAPATPACNSDLLDAAGALAGDMPCGRCGYNLRGLCPADLCPECAAPILTTVQGNLFRFADRKWLGRIDNGVRWMLWAGAGTLVVSALPFVPVLIPTAGLPMWLPMYLTPLMQLAAYYGLWLLTAREPECFEPGASLRVLLRIAVVVWLALRVIGLLLRANPFGAFIGSFGSLCVGTAADVATLVLLARLTARVPSARLTKHIAWFTGFYAIGFAIVLAASLFAWLCSVLGVRGQTVWAFLRIFSSFFTAAVLILFGSRLIVLFFVTKALAPVIEEPAETA